MKRRSNKPIEGERKTMKELTKDHDEFMKERNSGRRKENDEAKEKFESLIAKSVKR